MYTMKKPRAATIRLHDLAGGVEIGRDRLVIRLPDPRLLRLIARSILLAAVFFSFSRLRTVLRPRGGDIVSYDGPSGSSVIGDVFYLPIILADLRHRGLLRPGHIAKLVGDAGSWLPFLNRSGIAAISSEQVAALDEASLDFVFATGGSAALGLVDRAVKIGGVAAVLLESGPFRPPENYRIAYSRRLGPTVVALRKTGPASSQHQPWRRRRLMRVPEEANEAMNGLEDVLLEPPGRRVLRGRRLLRPRYLPELTGDSLESYRRRVFVEVVPAWSGGGGAAAWFERHYPRGAGSSRSCGRWRR